MSQKRKSSLKQHGSNKRRSRQPPVEEVTFNFTDREAYLTGFHKRKLQRINHAKETAAKKEREDKLAARKQLREERKANLERHIEAVNSAIQATENSIDAESDGQETIDEVGSWDGFRDDSKILNYAEEYVDEERFTTVTVEAVDIDRDGFHNILEKTKKSDNDNPRRPPATDAVGPKEDTSKARVAKARDKRDNPKKKKFRYESKAERKATRFKERMGNRAKAKARKAQ